MNFFSAFFLSFIFLFLSASSLRAQDSTATLPPEDFLLQVLLNHPSAQSAELFLDEARQKLRKAQGAFDPYFKGQLDEKEFKEKQYFSLFKAAIEQPTPFLGLSLHGGYERAQGEYVNAENTLPDDGLFYAGVSLPLLQGLLLDERRAELRMAKIGREEANPRRREALNDLAFVALAGYWEWAKTRGELAVYEQSIELAQTRFEAVKESFSVGYKPAIDTLEAFIQLQNRQISYSESRLKWRKQSLAIANFLWGQEQQATDVEDLPVPIDLMVFNASTTVPLADSLANLRQQLGTQNPTLLRYGFKLEKLDVERRWAFEQIKPKLKLKYNFLTETTGENSFTLGTENYKWGVSLSVPIPGRAKIAGWKLIKIKQQQTELAFAQKRVELDNKLQAYAAELTRLREQLTLAENNVENYQRLLDAEQEKYQIGESSLFLINSREVKLIESQLKVLALKAKLQKAEAAFQWTFGDLVD